MKFPFALTAALAAFSPLSAFAAPGDLDTTFADGKGFTITNAGPSYPYAASVVTQSNGKIVAAGTLEGQFSVLRYNANGTLDTTFGGTGLVAVNPPSGFSDNASAAAVQSDGAIVVAGKTSDGPFGNGNLLVMRFLADGMLDTTFDGDGRVETDVLTGMEDYTTAVAIQTDGKILVLGYSYQNSAPYQDVTLVRYKTDGTLDSTFGTGGKAFIDFGGYDSSTVLILQGDKILVAGSSNGNSIGFHTALARYNSDGTPDTTFGEMSNGQATFAAVSDVFTSNDSDFGMAVQPDGKIVLSGLTSDSGAHTQGFLLERYNADGTLDTAFGTEGIAVEDVGGAYGSPASVMSDSSGRLLVAGNFDNITNKSFLLLRYNADGTRDTTFGVGGKVTLGTGGTDDTLANATLQADGKLVVFGTATDTSDPMMPVGFLLARYKTELDAPASNKAPVVKVTGSSKITTTASSVTIKGTASDDSNVAKVLVSGKPAKGTASWSYKAKLKKVGKSKFTITATDDKGLLSAPVTVIVTRKAAR
ncbi:MAG: hypothetical protein ACREKL_10930 [Chthoniobacterales bacterium]